MNSTIGHTRDVVDMSACANKPGLVVSLAKDGNARVWDVPQQLCMSSYNTDASCLVRCSLTPCLIVPQCSCSCVSAAVLGECILCWHSLIRRRILIVPGGMLINPQPGSKNLLLQATITLGLHQNTICCWIVQGSKSKFRVCWCGKILCQ